MSFLNGFLGATATGSSAGSSFGSNLLNLGFGTAAAAINNALNWKYQQKAAAMQHKYNLLAFDHQLQASYDAQQRLTAENWQKYNSPTAQRQALINAGLNPGLMYSGNASSPGVGSSFHGGSINGSSLAGVHGNMSFDPVTAQQIDLMSSTAEENKAKAAQQRWETEFLNPFRQQLAAANALDAEQRAEITRVEARLRAATFSTDYATKLQQLINLQKEFDVAEQRINESKATEDNKRQEIELYKALSNKAYEESKSIVTNRLLADKRLNIWNKFGIDPNKVDLGSVAGIAVQTALLTAQGIDITIQNVASVPGVKEFVETLPTHIKNHFSGKYLLDFVKAVGNFVVDSFNNVPAGTKTSSTGF